MLRGRPRDRASAADLRRDRGATFGGELNEAAVQAAVETRTRAGSKAKVPAAKSQDHGAVFDMSKTSTRIAGTARALGSCAGAEG